MRKARIDLNRRFNALRGQLAISYQREASLNLTQLFEGSPYMQSPHLVRGRDLQLE